MPQDKFRGFALSVNTCIDAISSMTSVYSDAVNSRWISNFFTLIRRSLDNDA